MAIITKGTVVKGTAATFTLDKAELAADASVSGDTYFSDDANWAFVQLVYKSDVGGQSEIVTFDASQVSPQASFLVSDTARDVFEIQRLVIIDHDGGKLIIPRADLTTNDFDISFVDPFTVLYTRDFSSPQGKQGYELYNGTYGANYTELNFNNTGGGVNDTTLYNNLGAFSVSTPSGPTYYLRIHIQTSALVGATMDCYLNATPYTVNAAALNGAAGAYLDVPCPVDTTTTFIQLDLNSGSGNIRITKLEVGYL